MKKKKKKHFIIRYLEESFTISNPIYIFALIMCVPNDLINILSYMGR